MWIRLAGLVAAASIAACAASSTSGTARSSPVGIQQERAQFLDEMMAKGLFRSHRSVGVHVAEVVVTPLFMAQDYDVKADFVEVVYAYHFTRPDGTAPIDGTVVLRDSKTGKRVGTFGLIGGLSLY